MIATRETEQLIREWTAKFGTERESVDWLFWYDPTREALYTAAATENPITFIERLSREPHILLSDGGLVRIDSGRNGTYAIVHLRYAGERQAA